MGFYNMSRASFITFAVSIMKHEAAEPSIQAAIDNIGFGQAKVRLLCKHGNTKLIDIDHLKKGDVIEVLPGQMIPCDGEIVEGYATIDESPITGESACVLREAGGEISKVLAGTKVISNSIKIKITSSCKFSHYNRCALGDEKASSN